MLVNSIHMLINSTNILVIHMLVNSTNILIIHMLVNSTNILVNSTNNIYAS